MRRTRRSLPRETLQETRKKRWSGYTTSLGIALAGVLPKPQARHIISLVLVVMSTLGIAMALLGLVTSTLFAALLALAMGTAICLLL